jgi:DNA-binding PucR family transcriptional regulator
VRDLEFLRLLVEEAPVEAFEGQLREAREAGRSAAEVERASEGMLLALQVLETLAERRRREVELSALNETANDLTSMRDVGRVLQAIVRRSRHLLGTDTSYLTLIDEERGDTYMRVTEGITVRDFKELRLAYGVGLGGLVAQTKSPYATSNYFEDERFDHAHTIDDAVAKEHLVAILGVPILLGEDVIGVLFAANRHERPFSANEITLLSSLASHAGVAIENARLFQEARDALAELNEANRIISEHSAAVERAAASHERLTALVLAGGEVGDVAAAVAELFDSPLLVLDPGARPLAEAGPGELHLDDAVLDALGAARESGRTVLAERPEGAPACWVTPVVAGSEQLGTLVLCGGRAASGADVRTLERAAQVTALLLLNERSVVEAEQRVRGELLADLLGDPHRDPDGVRQRARLLAADLDREHVVVVAAPQRVGRHEALAAAAALSAELGGLAGEHQGEVVMLLPGRDPSAEARTAVQRLGGQLGTPVTAGAAGPAVGVTAIAEAHGDAQRCLHLLSALDRHGEVATAEELGAYGLVFSRSDPDDLERFVTRTLGPVLEYDRAKGTSLVETLEAYFAHGGNLARTAGALHVHVNTVYQRLGRISELLGTDWQAPEGALQVHLALRLHRLKTM